MNLINIAHAQGQAEAAAYGFVETLKDVILFPLIMLMLGVAVLVFLWGVFEYVYKSAEEGGRSTGRQHMLWGIIGFVVMLSAVAIMNIALGTFGIEEI